MRSIFRDRQLDQAAVTRPNGPRAPPKKAGEARRRRGPRRHRPKLQLPVVSWVSRPRQRSRDRSFKPVGATSRDCFTRTETEVTPPPCGASTRLRTPSSKKSLEFSRRRRRNHRVALTRRFDALFARHAGALPVTFLRALASRESNLNPQESRDPAWGLMQVVPVVRRSFNDRYGTSYSKQDLLNPDVNVRMATDLLKRIVRGYAKHPSPNMQANWQNPEFVKLLVMGWNAGYSEAAGVGKVARYLEARGIPVTHDNVYRHAAAAGATKWLQLDSRRRWQRSVVDLFYAEGGDERRVSSTMWKLAVTVAVAYVAYRALA
ncbi:MAG: transglycosylase SLT domain-containing protein [Kiloniellales bacterium]|nr:transglycosylase SLT domain-containing protein [Kiloniellales bacterium]